MTETPFAIPVELLLSVGCEAIDSLILHSCLIRKRRLVGIVGRSVGWLVGVDSLSDD